MFLNLYNHLIHFKVEQKYFEIKSKIEVQTALVFVYQKHFKIKLHNRNKFLSFKNKSKSAPWSYISFSSKLHQKIHRNNVHFFSIKIRSNKCRNDVDFSLIEITSSKIRWNDVNFLPIEITLKKVRENDIEFLPMGITSRKIRQNHADFLPNEITLKNYIKMMWTFVNIFPLTYRNKSLSNWCWFEMVCPLVYVIKVFVRHENNV